MTRFAGDEQLECFSLMDASVTLGPTPASEKLKALLDSFNTGDIEAHRQFIDETFAPSALKGQSVDQRALSDASLFRDTQGLKLIEVETVGENQVAACAQAALTGEWFAIRLDVVSTPPHFIKALTLRPGPRPLSQGRHPALAEDAMLSQLQELLDKLVAADMFSGVVLIARRGQPVFQFVCGLASQSFEIRNQLDTKFNVGSLAKTFTAVAITQLAEQGRLTFADALSQHLPDYPRPVADTITIHHLLTHTAGLGNYFNAKFEAARAKLRAVSDFIPLFIDDPLAFAPGDRWLYSNAGYILLGAVIERGSGQSYEDYVRDHIFTPAAMVNTGFFEMDRSIPNLALGYTTNGLNDQYDPGPRRNNLFMHVVKGGPAGGAFSTAPDLLNFSQALQGHRLLSPEMTETLMQGKVAMSSFEDRQYAYGLMVSLVEGKRIVGHSGTFPGIGARLDMFLDDSNDTVILSNYDPRIAQAIGNKLREWIVGY